MRKLLAHGISPNQPPPGGDGKTPLQLAVYYRADEIVLALLDAGAELDKVELTLVWAVCTKRADVVRRLIAAGADINAESFMGTPLRVAAGMGLEEITRDLITAGADLNTPKDSTDSPVAEAVQENQTTTALLLLNAGALPANPTEERTLLTQAVHNRNRELVKGLLKAGANPNERGKIHVFNDEGEGGEAYANATPLVIAARLGEAGIVADLVEAKADLYMRDEEGLSALERARREGHKQAAKLLARASAASPEKINPDEALLFASEKGDAKRVRQLLAIGANPDARDSRSRCRNLTPLMLAAGNGHAPVAAALLEAGADIAAKDDAQDSGAGFNFIASEGGVDAIRCAGFQMWRTALSCAAAGAHAEAGRLLIQRGADVNAADRLKSTPLLLAAESGSADLVNALIEAGADVNARDRWKRSTLHLAAQGGHIAAARALLEAGVKVDLKDSDGLTPLMVAACSRQPEAVALLLKACADIAATNREKETALHQALGTQHLLSDIEKGREITRVLIPAARFVDTVRLLVEAGADPSACSKYDDTPLKLGQGLARLTNQLNGVYQILKAGKSAAKSLKAAKAPQGRKK